MNGGLKFTAQLKSIDWVNIIGEFSLKFTDVFLKFFTILNIQLCHSLHILLQLCTTLDVIVGDIAWGVEKFNFENIDWLGTLNHKYVTSF